MYNNLQTLYEPENGKIQILCTRTVSSEPSVFAETEKIENPQNLRWLQMLSSPITDRDDVLYIIIGSSRECENNVANPSMCEVKIKMTATFYMYLIIINALS